VRYHGEFHPPGFMTGSTFLRMANQEDACRRFYRVAEVVALLG